MLPPTGGPHCASGQARDGGLVRADAHEIGFDPIALAQNDLVRATLVREPTSRATRRMLDQGRRLNKVTLKTGPLEAMWNRSSL